MSEMPKNGTPILAYCVNRHTKGWMVIQFNGHYWQTIPGKYGVERILRWAPLPPPALDDGPMQVSLPDAAPDTERKP